MKKIALALLLVMPLCAAHAQPAPAFNPDQSAYEINRNAIALAGYSRGLEQQVQALLKQLTALKAAADKPALPDLKPPHKPEKK